ncbi:hypothetical protein [Lysobacter sp. CA196]|uniref:hypothetical protein n=1 Tax=Lysobacter sp. CA196 TaxID=3455606 RepID=UPI003F8D6531
MSRHTLRSHPLATASRRSIALAALGLLAASAQASPAQTDYPDDIDKVRGCWIQRVEPDGPATLFLRLLPEPERKDWLVGALQRADGDDPDRRLRLQFARSGLSAVLGPNTPSGDAATPGPKPAPLKTLRPARSGLVHLPKTQMDYWRTPGLSPPPTGAPAQTSVIVYHHDQTSLRVEVSPEHLKLSIGGLHPHTAKIPEKVLFDGRRDGCD